LGELVASIFRAEEQAKRERSVKLIVRYAFPIRFIVLVLNEKILWDADPLLGNCRKISK
jgi:hypothetical protein